MIQRRPWHGVEWSLFIVLTGSTLLGLLYALLHMHEHELTATIQTILAILLSYGVPFLFWRPNYINSTFYPIAVLLTGIPLQIYLSWMQQDAYLTINCPLMVIGFLTDRKNAWWTAPIFMVAMPLEYFFILHSGMGVGQLFSIILNAVLFFAIGLSLQRVVTSNEKTEKLLAENQRQYRLIHEQNNALEQYANQIEQLTLLEERNRMARELHDTVGHTFTSVIMGMDAVSYLIETAPDKAKEKLDVLRSVTRNGLEEVRRSIHQMVPEGDMLLSQQLTRLANEFALHTGTQIRFTTVGEEFDIPKQTKLSLIRCLQESLTNAKRHGRASTVEVTLTYSDDLVDIRIEDDGIGTEQLKVGFGINAMQERIFALQGTLQVSSTLGQGTVVHCSIPAKRLPSF
ncbi:MULTISPECIES: sensor histidine kinase [unclassified Paenibacillus]|uniref:sensor histidine kinase n=1 Tax=unclassified Paenibacillus TaxID=185978 RepID=UPI002784597F|nr:MULTISPECIES: sensor histidine kinase [unclassified Paenibacillus]MDQ0903856.1 signal transduction histidine kinase [Paenibacillus sp. V4I7]MDQ0917670.1 signal transduction histidine kinase [Paenibacillus sp. V4I5]